MSESMKYKIKFYSDWHCGSGLSAGADLDSLVIKDRYGLPYVPGKTLKGLIREAVEEIQGFEKSELDLTEIFGSDFGEKASEQSEGCCFFTNACLKEETVSAIVGENLQKQMYRSIASTAINENGVALNQSLRKMEVVIPCELEGEILEIPDDFAEIMEKGLKFIKRLGVNRNKGFGRCSIEIIETSKNKTEVENA